MISNPINNVIIDAEKLIKDIHEDRLISTRNEPKL